MPRFDSHARLLGLIALFVGMATAWHYHAQGLTLSHYDAKAHLVVARRILDSLTPGWAQIGAVWLPLPHIVHLLPVQVDWLYRTGAFAVAVSIVCHAVAAASIFATVRMLTHSSAAAGLGAALFAINPNVLYLQSTPMTEPLFFALVTLEVLLLTRWVEGTAPDGADTVRLVEGTSLEVPESIAAPGTAKAVPKSARDPGTAEAVPSISVPHYAGWVMVLAMLTRYEAWLITAAALAASSYAWLRRGVPPRALLPVVGRLALYPGAAVLFFLCLSRVTVGAWFVTDGFFVPDPQILGRPLVITGMMLEAAARLGGTVFVLAALVAAILCLALGAWRPDKSAILIPLALFAGAVLPFYAYLQGHPFRIRYEVPLIVAAAVAIGLAVGQLRRFVPAAALALAMLVVAEAHPLDPHAPMVREAQADRRYIEGRRRVTQCLAGGYRGETILMSMNSLAHYMQELSAIGIDLVEIVHEGNHPIWDAALQRPAAFVGWVVLEERVGGGDILYDRQQANPAFLAGFDRVCEGGGVVLYRRR